MASFSTNDPLGLRGSGLDGEEVTELSAQGIEGMLEALEIVNQRTDKEALGAKVSYLWPDSVCTSKGLHEVVNKLYIWDGKGRRSSHERKLKETWRRRSRTS